MMSVAILGAGPSGLAAAHAVRNNGAEVSIYSKGQLPRFGDKGQSQFGTPTKSQLFGAQYLHEPIPGIDCGKPVDICVQFIGTADGYRQKVYGEEYRGPVSPNNFHSDHRAWDIRKAYDNLWDAYEESIYSATINLENIEEVVRDLRKSHNIIISTIPRRDLCLNPEHEFKSQKVYAIGDAPALGVRNPIHCEPNTLVYNGSPSYGWYRKSNMFGHSTAEWPAHKDSAKPPVRGVAIVEKPISTNCDCWPSLRYLGRYGAWKKGILVHHVYRAAEGAMRALDLGEQGALF
jgi:hypothetical protein